MRRTGLFGVDSALVFNRATALAAVRDGRMALTATLVVDIDLVTHVGVGLCLGFGLCFGWDLNCLLCRLEMSFVRKVDAQ